MSTSTLTIRIPTLHRTQADIKATSARFNVVCLGRRSGKTVLGQDVLVEAALEQGKPVGWFSPTYRMLSDVWRNVRSTLAPVTVQCSIQEHRMELIGGGTVEMWSLDTPDAARGRKYGRVIIDEAAMVPGLEDAWQAVIRPTLTDMRGDAWFLSTPRGMGFFKTAFEYGQDPQRPDWASWQMPTTCNPYIPRDEIEAARQDMTERRYAQEYMAQFLEGEGYVFRNVTALSTGREQEPYAGQFVAGVDFGRSNDYTVVSIVDVATLAEVYLDRFNGASWPVQRARLLAAFERYNVTAALCEENSFGGPNIQEMQQSNRCVQAFTTTQSTKKTIVENLVMLMENRAVTLLNDPVATGELMAYEETQLPSGAVRFSAPDGLHDDTVMARCLAYWAAAKPKPKLEWS